MFKLEELTTDTEEEILEKRKIWLHIQSVIKTFNMKTLKDYHNLYLKIDVLGLADVMEYYRETAYENYGLDPAQYIGLPSYTWDAGLKFTKVELENISDLDMVMMFEKCKRGEISVISGKYCKANNKYLPDHNSNEKSCYVLQLDRNNLYGHSMIEKLPIRNFKWNNEYDIKN